VLLQEEDTIDLVIPRGGEGLIRAVTAKSRIPVLQHYKGVCHVFLDASAPEARSSDIVFNAKVQRPGVCNALETLLVHREAAERFLPGIAERLSEAGVELRGCPETVALLSGARRRGGDRRRLARGVPGPDPGGAHRRRSRGGHRPHLDLRLRAYGGDRHGRRGSRAAFVAAVQSSTVLVNASTRFADGGELGLAPRSASRRRSSTPTAPWARASSSSCSETDRSGGEKVGLGHASTALEDPWRARETFSGADHDEGMSGR
jgi:glutamate-5-semialdehyde dehydrogenase